MKDTMNQTRTLLIITLTIVLVSCAPATTFAPAETAIPSVTNTASPPPPTLTPFPIVSKERFTNDYLEIAIPTQELIQKGMETGVIRQAIDVGNLTFEVHDNLNKPGQKIVFGRDPETQEIILATRVDPSSGEMVWQVAGLRDLADAVGMTIGTQLYSPNNRLHSRSDVQKINALVVQEYNHAIIIDVGWGVWLEKSIEGRFDFSMADEAVNLALANGMTVEGDDLVYGLSDYNFSYIGQIEDRLKKEGLNDEQIKMRVEGIVKNHIVTVMEHFKGRITEWSALNEWRGQNTENPDVYSRIWNKAQGTDAEFVKMVFQTARETDPAARLFYNDADINTPEYYGYPFALANVQMLENLGLIDAVGIQMTDIFAATPPDQSEIISTMKSWGVPVIVSSATFQMQDVQGTEEEKQARQAEVAVAMLDACVKSGVCKDFRMWDGYGDKFAFQGANTKSTIFDKNMKPKLAYFAIKDYLTQMMDLIAQ